MAQDKALSAQEASEQSIQRRGVYIIFRRGTKSCCAHQQATEKDRSEKGDVYVTDAFNFEACLLHNLLQTC